MQLTDQEKQLISDGFIKVAPNADAVAAIFYDRLFDIAPQVRPLFAKTDMTSQGQKLMQTLGTVIGTLHDLPALAPHVEALGRRHLAYGVTRDQYQSVGEALIWTLQEGLGNDFTAEAREAWTKIYGLLSDLATSAYKE